MLTISDLNVFFSSLLKKLTNDYIVVHFQNGYSDFYELALKKNVYVDGENNVSKN